MIKLGMMLLTICFILAAVPADCQSNTTKLYLIGLLPLTGSYSDNRTLGPATEMAIEDINANPDILPGYELDITLKDSACHGGVAVDGMYQELFDTSTTKIMIIGAYCSLATEPTAQASHLWNLIQISPTASSPNLSNRELFPRFFRLYPSESMVNIGRLALCKEFNWKKVATIQESAPIFSLSMADLSRDAKLAGIEVLASESFIDDPRTQVENIKNVGARIIFGGFYSGKARKVFCAAYHTGMFGAKYVWIVQGWLQWNWWLEPDDSIDCTPEQMTEAVTSTFGVEADSLPFNTNRPTPLSGKTCFDLVERLKKISQSTDNFETLEGYTYIGCYYDSVWTAALALHEAEMQLAQLDPPRTLADFDYDAVTVEILFDILSNMTFEGVTGPVQFTSTGDREGLILLTQLQDGYYVNVGVLDTTVESGTDVTWEGYTPIHWQGGSPPIDFIIEREDRQTIQPAIFITGVIFAVAGMMLAISFLIFNIHFRKVRVIKMSSPNINNMILIGGILSYLSIIFLGLDSALVTTHTFLSMCKARTWCLSIGFSLAFGSMFSKTWRVHKIFTNKTAMKMVVKDHRLFSFVAVLVLADVFILIFWEIFDPLAAAKRIGVKVTDPGNDDIVHIPIRMMCESGNQTYWIGAFYVIDGLLLIFGAFLAWETRKVTIPALNDSKYIGVCVYNVLILSFVGAPVTFVLEERNSNYILVSALVWLATTLTLCVVFVPKIRMRNEIQPAQNTTITQMTIVGRTEKSADSAQNEIESLRQEIARLKKALRGEGLQEEEGAECAHETTSTPHMDYH